MALSIASKYFGEETGAMVAKANPLNFMWIDMHQCRPNTQPLPWGAGLTRLKNIILTNKRDALTRPC